MASAAPVNQQEIFDHAELVHEEEDAAAVAATASAGTAGTNGPAPNGKPTGGTLATGTVKWYDPSKKFGFIMSDIDETDLFMHHQELAFEPEDSQQQVYKAQRVQFVYSWDGDRARARQVTQIGGKPLPSHPSLANPVFQQRLKENPSIRTGVIKWYNPDKGYGFVIPTDPIPVPGTGEMKHADVFVHSSRITCAGPRAYLMDKSPVEFELDDSVQQASGSNPKIEARVVTAPGGAAVMALPPGMQMPRGVGGGVGGGPQMAGMVPGMMPAAAGVAPMMFAATAAPNKGVPPGMMSGMPAMAMAGPMSGGAMPRGAFPGGGAAGVMPVNPYAMGGAAVAQPRIVSGPRYQGPVKWYSALKGFGFILGANEEEDLFMHNSSLIADDCKTVEIAKGQIVEYEITIQNGQQRAANVTLPNGLKLDDPHAAPLARAAAVPPPENPTRVGSKRKYEATFGSGGAQQPSHMPPQPAAAFMARGQQQGQAQSQAPQQFNAQGAESRYAKSPRQSLYDAQPYMAAQAAAGAYPSASQQQQQMAAAQQYNQYQSYYHPYDNQYA